MKNLKELFLKEVLQNIKSREAREFVEKELNYHLQRSRSEWISKGLSEEAAEEQAVQHMGNPSELGQQLNKLHRPKVDWMLLGLLIVALGMGFLPLLSVQHEYGFSIVANQAFYILVGVATALSMMYLDYRNLEKWSWHFLSIGILFQLALFSIPNITINGMPYIHVLGFSFSAITALPFLFLFWASLFAKRKAKLWLMILIYFTTTFLFIRLYALPVAMIYSILVLFLFWGSSFKRKTIYLTTLIVACTGLILISFIWSRTWAYQINRLLGFLNPEGDPNGLGYMYIKIKEMISGGGWFGNEKIAQFVPEMSTDFAFANITYFYGWLVAGFLVLMLTLIAVRMVFITGHIKDPFGKQLVTGTIALFTIQFLYNIGMSLGLLPIVTISLPFISYGLTPTVLNSFLIGIVLSVYRRKDLLLVEGNRKIIK